MCKNPQCKGQEFFNTYIPPPYKLHWETYNNRYAEIQKMMTQLDGLTLHHLWVSGVFTCKLPVCCSWVPRLLMHLTPPCTLHVTPLKKRLENDPSPIWLKPSKMIASFTTRVMVKMAPKIGILCGRYQFLGYHVKYHPKIGILVFGLPKSQSPKVAKRPTIA